MKRLINVLLNLKTIGALECLDVQLIASGPDQAQMEGYIWNQDLKEGCLSIYCIKICVDPIVISNSEEGILTRPRTC